MRLRACALACLLAACAEEGARPDVVDAPLTAGSGARVSPLPSALPPLAPSSVVSDVAPRVARSAPRDAQERAAWDLLAGRRPAADLPVESYEPSLRAPPTGERDLSSPVPQVRDVAMDVSPGLPPEVVRRILRQNFGRLRLCYENSLRNEPSLEGDVVTSFAIDAKGAVGDVTTVGGTLAKARMGACVATAMRSLSFPEPEGQRRVTVKLTHSFKLGAGR